MERSSRFSCSVAVPAATFARNAVLLARACTSSELAAVSDATICAAAAAAGFGWTARVLEETPMAADVVARVNEGGVASAFSTSLDALGAAATA